MAYVNWEMEGLEITNCNCNWGCPCQFNQLPTHGNCQAYVFFDVEHGHFGDVRLEGVRWGLTAAWPKAIHEGNGRAQLIVDDRVTPAQQAALEAIGEGRETEPGSLITQIFSTVISQRLPTVRASIDMGADVEARQGHVTVAGLLDSRISPLVNPVTGAPHRVRVTLPNGFEYTDAEFASGTGKWTGEIPLDFDGTHAHFARIHWSTRGVVR